MLLRKGLRRGGRERKGEEAGVETLSLSVVSFLYKCSCV